MNKAFDTVQSVLEEVEDVYSLPSVLHEIIEVINSPEAGVMEMRNILENDPPLAAAILRSANSAYYGGKGRISELNTAIVRLGFDMVRNIAVGRTVGNWFKGQGKELRGFTRESLWEHSVAVAATARMIAKRLGYRDFDTAFAGGLLHDIGVMIEDQHLHELFAKSIKVFINESFSFIEAERKIMGADHSYIGATLLENWKLPKGIVNCVEFHHQPSSVEDVSDRVLPGIVNLANFLCERKGYPLFDAKASDDMPDMKMVTELGIRREDLEVFYEDLVNEVDVVAALLT